jgi:hypothetical protein
MKMGMNLSVADPGCFSRISDLDFYPSWATDPGLTTARKEKGKKFVVLHFLLPHLPQYRKIKNDFIF